MHSQQCPAPAAPREPGALSPALEAEYGRIVSANFLGQYTIYDHDELVTHLRAIGARLAPHIPGLAVQPQFFLYDDPTPQAFAVPGGRIYVSRKAVAFARSEDELASILAHELGHAATGHSSALFARRLRAVLGVTEISEPSQVEELYHRMVETYREKRLKRIDPGTVEEQQHADAIGMFAMTRAGYDPQAMVTAFDRAAQTKGKTGSWFTDLFGATSPSSKRLRELAKHHQSLPAACRPASPFEGAAAFKAWQEQVADFRGWGRRESVPGLIAKKAMTPPLESELDHVRFSPDGKYLLAQDGSAIYVMSREPMKLLFSIEVENAQPARFTPDSRQVIFHDRRQRIARWDVAAGQLEEMNELVLPDGCRASELSPDGSHLFCYTLGWDLLLLDAATGAEIARQDNFFPRLTGLAARLLTLFPPTLKFSPDGRYAVATYLSDPWVFDLSAKKKVKIPNELEKPMRSGFNFLSPDSIFVNDGVLAFPAGGVVRKLARGRSPVSTTDPHYYIRSVAVPKGTADDKLLEAVATALAALPASGKPRTPRPRVETVWAIFDAQTDRPLYASRVAAVDVSQGELLIESSDGKLVRKDLKKEMKVVAEADLPRGYLGSFTAYAASPALDRIAVAQRRRAAVWNLTADRREQHIRSFRAAHFAGPGVLLAEFPADEDEPPAIHRLEPAADRMEPVFPLPNDELRQVREFLYSLVPNKDAQGESIPSLYDKKLRETVYPGGLTLTIAEAASGKTLWTRAFQRERPYVGFSPSEPTMVLLWRLETTEVQRLAAADPSMAARIAAMGSRSGDYLVQVLDARNGQQKYSLLLETGKASFAPRRAFAAGQWLVLTDSHQRVLIYSLVDGQIKGRFFGTALASDPEAGHLALVSGKGQVEVIDLRQMRRRESFVLDSPVAFVAFAEDARRLLAFTYRQTAYTISLTAPSDESAK